MALPVEQEGGVGRVMTVGTLSGLLLENSIREAPERPHWIRTKDAATALSLSNLAFLPVWSQLIGNSLDERASYGQASTRSLLAVVTNILVAAAVFYISTTVLRRTGRSLAVKAAQGLFWLFFMFSMASVVQSFTTIQVSWASAFEGLSRFSFVLLSCSAAGMCISARLRLRNAAISALLVTPFVLIGNVGPLTIGFMLLALGLLMAVMWQRNISRAASAISLVLFPFVPTTLFQAGWLISEFMEKPRAAPVAPSHSVPRIVWIVFDELDYKTSFEQRPTGLELPEMDRLRGESIFATNAYPPSDYTMLSMPALISGRLVSAASPKNPSTLMVTYSDSVEPISWGSQPSIFTKARDLGVNSAIVGWYHPYCRIIGDQLVRCMSCNTERSSLAVTTVGQVFTALRENALMPRVGLLDTSLADARRWREELIETNREIREASLEAVSRSEIGLLLLHFPVPHPPAIFNRLSNEFDASGDKSYLDGLKLVDNTIGELRRTMENSGLWEDAVVVVSSDHWWRGDLWRYMRESRARSWNAEDESAFSGIDERVPFMVKLPRQQSSIDYTHEFNTVVTHDLFLALLSGSLSDRGGVVNWLDAHPSSGTRPYKYQKPH